MPLHFLPFRTIVLASQNDPAVSFKRARFFAESWGGDLIDLGAARHIDEKPGHGPWPDGHKLVERLLHANGRSG
jgi:predicted alpha/beta hydrolase family esterase